MQSGCPAGVIKMDAGAQVKAGQEAQIVKKRASKGSIPMQMVRESNA